MKMRGKKRNRRAAFSLVEVTLALMVVSMGLLAILSMFSAGLDQSSRSRDTSLASLFAEELFSSLHAETNWPVIGGTYNWPWIEEAEWAGTDSKGQPVDKQIYIETNLAETNTLHTNVYVVGNAPDVFEHHILRYRLVVPDNIALTNYCYLPDPAADMLLVTNLLKCAVLETWPGRFGSQAQQKEVFYTEFFNFDY